MKTTAVRLYGESDLRIETFDLPDVGEDCILARVVSDSICMSSHKLAIQGAKHKRVRYDLAEEQPIIGHEFCGTIEKVSAKWASKFKAGEKFAIQPAINYKGTLWAPGYSYKYIGGDATYVVIPPEVMETDSLLKYSGDNFFMGSLAEPVSCIIGAFHAQYHTTPGSYVHSMGIVEKGSLALLAGVGPMGLGAIDYAIHCDRRPSRMVVTDIDETRLARAKQLFPVEEALKNGVELHYVNTAKVENPVEHLKSINGGVGYDDVFVFAPVKHVIEQGDAILGNDGCLNFFAGPTNPEFSASMNFYAVHYASHHIVGTSGGNTQDMIEALNMMSAGKLNPASMITHIGGLNCVRETTINLDKIPGGKKLVYTHKNLPLTSLTDFAKFGESDPMFAKLAEITSRHNGLWSAEAEAVLLRSAPNMEI